MPTANGEIDHNLTYKCYAYPDGANSTPHYITAESPDDAAEKFHEIYNLYGYTSEITVSVIDPDGNETRWDCVAEHEVQYYAHPAEII